MLKNWIKENFVLALGLSLPLLLIIIFMASTVIPTMLATPPQYKLLFWNSDYGTTAYNYKTSFVVEGGQLKMKLQTPAQPSPYSDYNRPRLMVYDGKTNSIREINLNLPLNITEPQVIVLEDTQNMKIDTNMTAPDGYSVSAEYGWRGGLIPEIYGSGYYRGGPRVKKGAASFKIPLENRNRYGYYSYGEVNFIGWVVEEK